MTEIQGYGQFSPNVDFGSQAYEQWVIQEEKKGKVYIWITTWLQYIAKLDGQSFRRPLLACFLNACSFF